jgi:HSP20 family protein
MWGEACDLIEQAERLHRQFFRLNAAGRSQATWEPPVDVFESEQELIIVAAMPGVTAERVEVVHEPGALVVRGERPLPLAGVRLSVRQLEIPYGRFERRVPLPNGRFEYGAHELTHGCLVLRLHRIG